MCLNDVADYHTIKGNTTSKEQPYCSCVCVCEANLCATIELNLVFRHVVVNIMIRIRTPIAAVKIKHANHYTIGQLQFQHDCIIAHKTQATTNKTQDK